MDPLPQIPIEKNISNDTTPLVRALFEDELERESFPQNVARNIFKYDVDDELSLKDVAKNAVEIQQCRKDEESIIGQSEFNIAKQHGCYLLAKSSLEKDDLLKEIVRLKSCDIFSNISLSDKMKFGLIEKCDLYPDYIRQYLDFRFNSGLHQCKNCFPKEQALVKPPEGSQQKTKLPQIVQPTSVETFKAFQLKPRQLVFRNFELNTLYEEPFKVTNVSNQTQIISVRTYPKTHIFTVHFEAGQKVAPGMYAIGTVKFTTDCVVALHDQVTFITRKGEIVELPLSCQRDPPKLAIYMHRYNKYPAAGLPRSNRFSIERQQAVNSTFDCGSCFVTNHVLISLILSNTGNKAQFFWIPEEDFFFQDIRTVSNSMELTMGEFWMYPTFFQMDVNDICEINILYQPLECGLHTHTLFLLCDNNTYKQVELIGDGVCFNLNMLSINIPYIAKELEKRKNHRIFLGHLGYLEKVTFSLSIVNRSPLCLNYALHFKPNDATLCMVDWLRIVNTIPKVLAPYSTTDIIIESTCKSANTKGYFNANLRLFVTDVPIASLEAGQTFEISTKGKSLEETVTEVLLVDVLVTQLELACYADPQEVPSEPMQCAQNQNDIETVKCLACGIPDCCGCACEEPAPQATLHFSTTFLDLGLLPVGVDFCKTISIINTGDKTQKWAIAELEYHMDSKPHLEILDRSHLSATRGTLHPGRQHKLRFEVVQAKTTRHVSVLILFSRTENDIEAQSICVVAFEIVQPDIRVKTGPSRDGAILCPMEMLYTDIPTTVSFKIQNCSLITGCFYFMKPIGMDAEKVSIECHPQSGELKPLSSKLISMQLTCHHLGILEYIFIPCFIGKGQDPIQIRLLCVVDCIHAFVYLPTKHNEYEKILWPPKVVYEFDRSWSEYCICEEENSISSIQLEHGEQIERKSEETLSDINHPNDSFASGEEKNNGNRDILKTFLEADSEVFLQECVMQIKEVKTKDPLKFTIFIENVTPKHAKFSIQSTNYPSNRGISDIVKWQHKKKEHLWEPLLQDHGILIHPETETGNLRSHELLPINVWIYANTWGIYCEEIVVDIEDIAPFSYTLLVEVVGCPLQLPLAWAAITDYPTIRFGTATFASASTTKEVLLKNVSAIDLSVSWHVFYYPEEAERASGFNLIYDVVEKSEEQFQFDFTQQFFGIEATECIEIQPSKLAVNAKSEFFLPITFNPNQIKISDNNESIPIECFVLGKIFTSNHDKLKSSYYYRDSTYFIMKIKTVIVKPRLDVEIDDDTLHLYANDIALRREAYHRIRCELTNSTSAPISVDLKCTEPFTLEDAKLTILPGKCKELNLICALDYEKIVKWAPYVYKLTETKEGRQVDSGHSAQVLAVKSESTEEKNIDYDTKTLTLLRKLILDFSENYKTVIPLTVHIQYPQILVKPAHIKFEYVLLGRTEKAVVFIYNLTGCIVSFDIYKTLSSQEIVVTPCQGFVEGSTGMNHNFTTLAVYFTPKERRMYHESIRIMTNIPQYYVDVSVKGNGAFNEKFE